MIEYGLLVALGFFIASLLAILFAGPFWRRAVRLTKKRIEATMPMSIADIQAEKDQIRADYAVQIRRAEMARDREKQNAARFLVERNKYKVEIADLKARVESLMNELDERGNESTVLEQTVRKRIPELEQQLERARQIIAARDRELARMTTAYENQTEALGIAKKAAQTFQEEIERLRAVLESGEVRAAKGGEETPERENLRLQAELSRLRQQVQRYRDVEATENALLRSELTKLADQMMSGAAPREKPQEDAVAAEGEEKAAASPKKRTAAKGGRKPRTRKAPARRTRSTKKPSSLSDRLKKLAVKTNA